MWQNPKFRPKNNNAMMHIEQNERDQDRNDRESPYRQSQQTRNQNNLSPNLRRGAGAK